MGILLSLYIAFTLILGALGFVLKKKRSRFPDTRVGYHNKMVMESKEKWEHANNVAGNLCALFAAIDIVVFAVLYFFKASIGTTIIVFLVYSVITILAVLIVPVHSSKKYKARPPKE